jgi:hypothetical protein
MPFADTTLRKTLLVMLRATIAGEAMNARDAVTTRANRCVGRSRAGSAQTGTVGARGDEPPRCGGVLLSKRVGDFQRKSKSLSET